MSLSAEELWKRKDFDFEELLEPYREGGTKNQPVNRTVGTMIDWMVNKKKYPIEIAGSGLLLLFMDLKAGRKFKGDGSYGSPGREMITTLRQICDRLLHGRLESKFYKQIAEARIKEISELITVETASALPVFIKPFSGRWWQARSIKKKRAENELA